MNTKILCINEFPWPPSSAFTVTAKPVSVSLPHLILLVDLTCSCLSPCVSTQGATRFSMGFQITSHHNFVNCSGLLFVTTFCHRIQYFLSSLEITYLDRLKDPLCVVWNSARWGLRVILCPTNPFAFPPLSSPLQGSHINEKSLMISPTM